MNRITINGIEKVTNEKQVPETVKVNEFGCRNCLWASCECQSGSKYIPNDKNGCEGYTYYD